MSKEFDVQQNVSLADYVSWQSSGLAKQFFQPTSIDHLQAFLKQLPVDEKILWLGLGSNLLVRQGGFAGTVIFTQKHLRQLNLLENNTVHAECGVACPTLARFAAKHNLAGGEWFAGVPGTVGGALLMNAGAFGGETWQHVQSVTCINRHGDLISRQPNEFSIAYRNVLTSAEEWFVSGIFNFVAGEKQTSLQKINQLLEKRAATQPTGLPTCGSVFRNPPGDYAARLIETCGLKGYRLGEAEVSQKHANFIINLGNANPNDIEDLINYVAKTVFAEHGVELHTEVKIVGER